MPKPKSITPVELSLSIGTCIIGVGLLSFPRLTVDLTGTGAPITTMFAILFAVLGTLVMVYLGNQYPNQTLFEYSDCLVGKWVGGIILFIIGCYFMELSALTSREFGEVVVTSVLRRTPIPATVLVMLILAGIASRNDIAKSVRILTFYMPMVYVPALVIVVLSLKSARMVNVMPMVAAFQGVPITHTILSICIVTALYQNVLITGLVVPFMYDPNKAYRGSIIGIGIAGGLYLILIYSTLSVFGTEEMKNLMWPTLELAKTAALPAFFIERLDPIFLAVWVTAVFCAIFAAYYLSIQAFGHFFRMRDHRVFSIAGLPIVYVLASLPTNVHQLYTIVKIVGVCGLPLTFGYPLILLLTHWARGGKLKADKRARKAGAT